MTEVLTLDTDNAAVVWDGQKRLCVYREVYRENHKDKDLYTAVLLVEFTVKGNHMKHVVIGERVSSNIVGALTLVLNKTADEVKQSVLALKKSSKSTSSITFG